MKAKILLQLFRSKKQSYAVNINTISKQVNASGTASETESRESCIKWRYIAALLGFAIFNLLSMHRLNFNVSIVAMVNHSASKGQDVASGSCPIPNVTDEDSTHEVSKVREGEFGWTPGIQGYIVGSSFVGYFLTNFIGGKLAEIFGFKWISFCGVFLASLCTILTPFAAWFNVYALIAAQTLRGMAQGVFQPCISILTANWFPKNERGSICAFILSGQGLGALIGGYVSGILCESSLFDGWPSAFYTFGIVGMVLAILIAAFLYENPSVHPRISKKEMNYILSRQESSMSQKRPSTPWGSIFTSVPFYALTCAYFGQFWAAAHFLAVHPLYLGTILHFPIQKNGLLSSMPFILLSTCGMLGSSISAFLTKKKYVGTSKQRKIWNTLSCVGYSAGVLGISLVECNKEWSIAFSFISLAFQGLGFSGCLVVPADMSPTFAGSLTGIACTVGSASAFILPLVVGFLTDGKQTIEQWQIFFYISIGITMSSAIVFAIFGSADIQPWNFVKEKNPSNDEKNKELKKENDIKLNRINA